VTRPYTLSTTLGLLSGTFAATLGLVASSTASAIAQNIITPDDTLGSDRSQVTPLDATTTRIDGGALQDSNLFHSFQDFNIGEGLQVYFNNPTEINNIFSRVTGDNASNILGTLGVEGPANLYFINPNGIVFGPNASLSIEGSFSATTADGITFQDGTQFSAAAPRTPSPLTVSVPLGLQPGPSSDATLENNATLRTGQNLTLSANRLALNEQLFAGGDLLLRSDNPIAGSTQYQSGGSFRIENADGALGRLDSPNGSVIRAGGSGAIGQYSGASLHILAGGSVDLERATITTPDATNNTTAANNTLKETVALSDGTVLQIDGAAQPTVDIRAGIETSLNADISVGNIDISSPNGLVLLTNRFRPGSNTGNITVEGEAPFEGIRLTNTEGKGGNIFLQSRNNIDVLGSLLFASAFEQTGTISISAADDIRFDTRPSGNASEGSGSPTGFRPTGVFSSASKPGRIGDENNGDIRLTGNNISFTNGSFLSTSTFQNSGNAGDIVIDAQQTVRFAGIGIDSVTALPIAVSGAFSSGSNSVSGNGGDIRISANNVEIEGGAKLITSILSGTGRAGDITINATDTVRFDSRNSTTDNGANFNSLITSSLGQGATGQGGNISITAKDIEVANGAQINASTSGLGPAGNISLNIAGAATLDEGIIFSSIEETGNGSSGNIRVSANRLEMINGGQIISSSAGIGNAGNIILNITERTRLDGMSDRTEALSLVASSIRPGAEGTGGDIRLTTGSLALTNGGGLRSNSSGRGDAGNVIIDVAETARFSGTSIGMVDSSGVVSRLADTGQGKGGDIDITATNIEIEDFAVLSADSEGTGNAGNITLNLLEQFRATDGSILTSSIGNSGGNITLNARDVRLYGDSNLLTAAVGGEGGGGDITITANTVAAFDDSDILAFSQQAQGGNITIAAPAFLGENYSPAAASDSASDSASAGAIRGNGNGQVDINASGSVSGTISLPDVSFIQDDLVELPSSVVNTDRLIAGSCITRRANTGSFLVSGSGSLAKPPGENAIAAYPLGNIQRFGQETSETEEPHLQANQSEREPQGIFQLADGRIVMSRSCPR